MNKFTFDIDIIDKRIPGLIGYVTLLLFLVLVDIAAVLIGVDNLLIAIPCAVFLVIGHIIRSRYMRSKREMMRLYSISKSPISGLAESIIKGSTLIRALRREEYFTNKMHDDIDENSKSGYVSYGLDKWFQQRMAIVAWVIVLIPAYAYVIIKFLTMEPQTDFKYDALVFFVLRTASLAADYTTFCRDFAELEYSMIAIERCKAFEDLDPEKAYKNLEYSQGENSKKKETPNRDQLYSDVLFKYGQIQVQDVTAYYPGSSNANPVLNCISIEVLAGQKIGVVGRTGAGKSSFIKIFSRLLVPKKGAIKIDGLDISKIDLKHLRH